MKAGSRIALPSGRVLDSPSVRTSSPSPPSRAPRTSALQCSPAVDEDKLTGQESTQPTINRETRVSCSGYCYLVVLYGPSPLLSERVEYKHTGMHTGVPLVGSTSSSVYFVTVDVTVDITVMVQRLQTTFSFSAGLHFQVTLGSSLSKSLPEKS